MHDMKPVQDMLGMAMLVNGTIEIVPFCLNRNVGLIHAPGGANRLGEPSPARLEPRDVARDPAEDRSHVNRPDRPRIGRDLDPPHAG